ncbi:TPA: DUF2913 family protein [Klebsiella aerogenes]|nr:DUF2913 family protein [Klebsiella aerogenes]
MSRAARWKNIQTLPATAGITAKVARQSPLIFIEMIPMLTVSHAPADNHHASPLRTAECCPEAFPVSTGPLYSRAMHKKDAVSPEQTVADLSHLAWCALVALRLARQEGQALTPLMAHTFLLRWLASAQKQRRFPKTVAPDIESLLNNARRNGQAAKLQHRLEYLWQSCSSPVDEQSDLFRLTYAIEALKAAGWQNISLPDNEWHTDKLIEEFSEQDSILLLSQSALKNAFADDGRLLCTLDFLVKGDNAVLTQAMTVQKLLIAVKERIGDWAIVALTPDQQKNTDIMD